VDCSVTAPARCFENETITVSVTAHVERPLDTIAMHLRLGRQVAVVHGAPNAARIAANELSHQLDVRVARWGRRHLGTAIIDLTTGLRHAHVAVDLGEVAVFPTPAPLRRLDLRATRHDQIGEHVARQAGPGVEFAKIRPFSAGDPLARINWPATLRHDQLLVTQTAAERAVDVVLVLDCFDNIGLAGRSSLDHTVRAATGIARLVLKTHDRVGVVALGGWLRWVRPDLGARQFYRIAEAMLDVIGRESYVDPDLARITPGTLPAGCLVLALSPLLDERARTAIRTLRGRGHPITVVDVLTAEPTARLATERLARRLWLLQRDIEAAELGTLGVPVVSWDGTAPLDVALTGMLPTR
jgi:uncharacterized protein (DUF58 family)